MTRIEYDDFSHRYEMKNDNDDIVCELNLLEEETYDGDCRYWLNGIFTEKGHERNGYAQALIERAIEDYGKIYISSATAYEHKNNNDDSARELTTDGANLVNGLKQKGILKSDWFVNPFGNDDYYDEY